MMGSPEDEEYRRGDEVQHNVTLTQDFYIGKYAVTQAQWKAVMGNNPSWFSWFQNDYPVEEVSWNDCQEFIKKLNKKTGIEFKLPTEAEWEYAAKGGENYKYSGSNNLDEIGWYKKNSDRTTHPVGQKKSNGFGLYDMSGNVWEWCQDRYCPNYYSNSPENNPHGPIISSGRDRCLRGGSWEDIDNCCRSASRWSGDPNLKEFFFGLRLVKH